MKKLIPENLSYEDGTQVPFVEIRERYAKSKYGSILNEQLRWTPNMRAGTTPDQWRKIFGADVNNLLHMDLSYGLVKTVARHFKSLELTTEDLEILLLTAQTHDWAEAVTGDISFIYKKESDEEEEIRILRNLLDEFLPEDRNSNSPKIPQVIATLTDKDSLRYKFFHVVERIGYLRTSKRAYQVKDEFTGEQQSALHAMGCQPFINNAPVVIDFTQEFPELKDFFLHSKVLPTWKKILADCDHIDYEKFYPNKGRSIIAGLPSAKNSWNNFLERHSKA